MKYLVDAHGGTITARSPGEGQGATFTVRLPLLRNQPILPAINSFFPTAIDLAGIKVLAVDDNEDTRDLVTTFLTESGAAVRVVSSGEEVLALLNDFQPDVLVSDIDMPGMDGYRLLQRIRCLPPDQGGQIPAIALTAFVREEDYQYALEHGFQRHITKPLVPDKLAIAIAELAGGD